MLQTLHHSRTRVESSLLEPKLFYGYLKSTAADMTLEKVQKDATSWVQHAQLASSETERLKQQLAMEKKSVSEMSMELHTLKTELENNKNETKHLKSMKRSSEDRRFMKSKELEDARNTIIELKEELSYKSSVNHCLRLQLEKTIESNSELLLEIKDLDGLLQSREREIEELKAESCVLREREMKTTFEGEKVMWMKKLEESEREIKDLKEAIANLEETGRNLAIKNNTEDLLRKDLEKAERDSADIREENMNLLSQLMDLRHQTDEKDALVHQLESELVIVQNQSLIAEKALEKKAKDLQAIVNELREKLHLSEELSQSQLDSNKVFLEDLNSTVVALHARNEQLEILLKSSEDKNSCLVEELDTVQKQILEHEKERSLLLSQRGQLKILREKIATITENYEIALERGEDLELANKTLREENHKALTTVKQQLISTEDKLHEANAECLNLKNMLEVAQTQGVQASEQISLILVAKDVAEASLSSLQVAHTQLQEQITSLLVAKEKAEASLSSLQVAHAELQEQLKGAEQSSTRVFHQLQERDAKITNLVQDLDTAQGHLQKTRKKLLEVEATKSELEERLQDIQEEKRLQKSNIEDLELQLSCIKEEMDVSSKSLSASEDRAQDLRLQNDELAEKLHAAVSHKEDVACRFEAAKKKEAELQRKLEEMGQALHGIKGEKVICDQTMVKLEDKIRFLDDERDEFDQEEAKDEDKQELQKILQAQLEGLKASLHEMKLEKDKAESSLQKLHTDNARLAQELTTWKEKAKVDDEELAVWKEKAKTGSEAIGRLTDYNISLEEKVSQLQDFNAKGARRAADLDQRSELLRLRKHTADLKRKLLEQEEDKEEIRKKLFSLQKEVQRKSDLLALTEKRLKEKEREERGGQRRPTKCLSKANHKVGMASSTTPHDAKALADLTERVKLLEGELNIKSVELEATKFVLKEKEAELSNKMEHSELGKEAHVEGYTDTHIFWLQNELEWLQKQNAVLSQQQQKLLTNVGSQEALQDEVKRLHMENQQLGNLFLELNEATKEGNILNRSQILEIESEDALEVNIINKSPLRSAKVAAEQHYNAAKGTHLEEELREMRDRYSQMSLQFAELQAEKEELLMAIRNLCRDGNYISK